MPFEELKDIHVTWLSGLGSSYRMKGFFRLFLENKVQKINYKGVAFGGIYGGHNVSVEISKLKKKKLKAAGLNDQEIEELLTEVQKRIMQGDMVVEFEKIKPEQTDTLGNISG